MENAEPTVKKWGPKYKPCRKCGGTDFNYKIKMSGTCTYNVNEYDSPTDNWEMHNALTFAQVSIARCSKCRTKAELVEPVSEEVSLGGQV